MWLAGVRPWDPQDKSKNATIRYHYISTGTTKSPIKLGMVVCTYNSSWEVKAGGLKVEDLFVNARKFEASLGNLGTLCLKLSLSLGAGNVSQNLHRITSCGKRVGRALA